MNSKAVKKKYKIVSKPKFLRFIFMLILLGLIFTLLLQNRNQAYSSTYKEKYIEIEVKKGDTLWGIAKQFMPAGYDVRKMVFEIRQLNHMDNADIYPTDQIKVPIK